MQELWQRLQGQEDISKVAAELEKRARLGVFYTFDLAGRAQLRELTGKLASGDLITQAAETLARRQGALARDRAVEVLGRATQGQVSPYARLAAQVLVTDSLRRGMQGGATLGGATHKRFTRVRPVREPRSHSVLEGAVKPIDEPFYIGGIPVHGPGAEALPWSEKAWCSHALKYLRLSSETAVLPAYEPSNEVTTSIERLPIPKTLTYLEGPTQERVERLYARLQQDYPAPRPTTPLLAKTEERWQEIKSLLKIDPNDRAAAIYVRQADVIAFSPKATALLDHPDIRGRLAGTRYAIHEWFHPMRLDDRRVYALEEGGAELFADRVTRLLTGVDGSLRRIQPYSGFAKGAQLLGEQALGQERAYHWVMESRQAGNIRGWLSDELRTLEISDEDIQLLMDYDVGTSGSWLQLVMNVLKRRGKWQK